MPSLADLLSLGRPLLADGALGSNLWAGGEPTSVPVEVWNVRAPARVEALHRSYVAVGADIILTNTFGGNRHRLAAQGLEGRLDELNTAGVRLAHRVATATPRPVLVAGAVGPTGADAGRLTERDASALFAEQMRVLASGGVGLIWIETMSSVAEARAAAHAAGSIGLPYVLTASPHPGSQLGPTTLASLVRDLDPSPVATGYNCGNGLSGLIADLTGLAAEIPGLSLVAKPNAGVPEQRDRSLRYPETAGDFAGFAPAAERVGVRILGGCCGTTPSHIDAMSRALRAPGRESVLR